MLSLVENGQWFLIRLFKISLINFRCYISLKKGVPPLFFLTKLNSLYARVVCWNWKLPSSSGVVANAKSLQTNDRLTEGRLKQVIRKNCMIFQFRWCKIVILKQRVYQNCKKKIHTGIEIHVLERDHISLII